MAGIVLRSIFVHNEAAGHEANRDQDASDGKEFDVAMHGTSDHRKPVSATRCTAKSSGIALKKRELGGALPGKPVPTHAIQGLSVPGLNAFPTLH